MIFHSLDFLVFLILVFSSYWMLSRMWQNILLLVSSYIFYGYIHHWFLILIFSSTVVDYVCARAMGANPKGKKVWLLLSLTFNLGMLGFFKYFNFFISSFRDFFEIIGLPTFSYNLEILLPVGISFYTFQTLSYTIDVYRGQMQPRKSFLDVAAYVSFFPQLVAGPIERASHFLPQIESKRVVCLRDFERGLFLIVWGFLKKLVIADTVAVTANRIFSLESPSFPLLWTAVLAFCIQIYADFSAYTDIARGVARIFGFRLMENFRHPYLASAPSDFWRRWHISLSTWFRDYVYIPLGGSRSGQWKTAQNIMITFLLSGLWHGASWNFVIWGAYHGVLLLCERMVVQRVPGSLRDLYPVRLLAIVFTFVLINIGWFIFRETNTAFLLRGLFLSPFDASFFDYRASFYLLIQMLVYSSPLLLHTLISICVAGGVSGTAKEIDKPNVTEAKGLTVPALESFAVTLMIFLIIILRSRVSSDFIYFQF